MSLRVFILIISASFFATFTCLVFAADHSHDVAMTKSTAASAPDEKSSTRSNDEALSNFKQLDAETETILKEVLNLSSDLSIIDERENNPAKFQLFVLVTMDPTNLFELDFIELQVDKQTVAAHHYTDLDLSSMSRGGGHQLYLANLPAGMHKLKAKMVGRIPRDPDYRRETSFSFISGVSRTIIELSIATESGKGFPTLIPKERN